MNRHSYSHNLSPRVRGNPYRRIIRLLPEGVYPRVCGGTHQICVRADSQSGLSPRVRGNRLAQAVLSARAESILACAGEPHFPPTAPPSSWVYPRVCGGTARASSAGVTRRGLSPRVRGNRILDSLRNSISRSIPACAGEPDSISETETDSAVYPRVCGGTHGDSPSCATSWGLSPRVRGNRTLQVLQTPHGWSIPACAGEPT